MSPSSWPVTDVVLLFFEQPNYMFIDYVRVYQRTDMINIGCDPDDYPTQE